jgi:hypothetical protein
MDLASEAIPMPSFTARKHRHALSEPSVASDGRRIRKLAAGIGHVSRLGCKKRRPVLSIEQLKGARGRSSRGLILPAASPYGLHDPMAKNTARATEDEGGAPRDADRGRPQHAIRADSAPAKGQERS